MQGDNYNRVSGEALEFQQLTVHAIEALDKGTDVHLQVSRTVLSILLATQLSILLFILL